MLPGTSVWWKIVRWPALPKIGDETVLYTNIYKWGSEAAKLPGLKCWLVTTMHHATVYSLPFIQWNQCRNYMNLSPGSHHAGNTIVPHLHSVPVALENAPQATAGQHSIRSTLTHCITSGFTTCIFSSRSRLPPRDMKIFVIICYPSKQMSCIYTCQAQLANNSSI